MADRRGQAYSILSEDGSDNSPSMMPHYHHGAPPISGTMSSNNTNVVELQPMSGQQPQYIQVVKPQANDHLWLTLALIFLCFMLGCNVMGVLCLLPALLCASVAADYNKEGNVEKARSCGTMAFVHDMVIVVMYITAYAISVISTVVAVAIVFSKASETITTVSNTVSNTANSIHNVEVFTPPPF